MSGTTSGVFRGNRSVENTSGGFTFQGSSGLQITGNVARGNGPDGGNGFLFQGSHDLQIEDNVAKDSPWACFGLYDGTHGATLVGNKASGCSAAFDLNADATRQHAPWQRANGNVGGNGFSLDDGAATNPRQGTPRTRTATGSFAGADATGTR